MRHAIAPEELQQYLTSFLLDRAFISCRGEQEAAALAFEPTTPTSSPQILAFSLLEDLQSPIYYHQSQEASDLKLSMFPSLPKHQAPKDFE